MNKPETYNRAVAIGVDIQNDFCPGGSLAVSEGDEVIEPFNKIAQWTRDLDGDVFLSRDWHKPNTDHFNIWPPHCVEDTQGAEFHPKLMIEDTDIIISKGMDIHEDAYSAFDGITDDGVPLEKLINPDRLKRIAMVIGGLATDYCVGATALKALNFARREAEEGRTVDVYVVEEAIRAVNVDPDDGRKAIEEMKANGAKFIHLEELLGGDVIKIER